MGNKALMVSVVPFLLMEEIIFLRGKISSMIIISSHQTIERVMVNVGDKVLME